MGLLRRDLELKQRRYTDSKSKPYLDFDNLPHRRRRHGSTSASASRRSAQEPPHLRNPYEGYSIDQLNDEMQRQITEMTEFSREFNRFVEDTDRYADRGRERDLELGTDGFNDGSRNSLRHPRHRHRLGFLELDNIWPDSYSSSSSTSSRSRTPSPPSSGTRIRVYRFGRPNSDGHSTVITPSSMPALSAPTTPESAHPFVSDSGSLNLSDVSPQEARRTAFPLFGESNPMSTDSSRTGTPTQAINVQNIAQNDIVNIFEAYEEGDMDETEGLDDDNDDARSDFSRIEPGVFHIADLQTQFDDPDYATSGPTASILERLDINGIVHRQPLPLEQRLYNPNRARADTAPVDFDSNMISNSMTRRLNNYPLEHNETSSLNGFDGFGTTNLDYIHVNADDISDMDGEQEAESVTEEGPFSILR